MDSSECAILPQHVLLRRVIELNRRIYASMPWGYRLAGLLMLLAGDLLDAFGRVVTGEMVLAGVRGLPAIGGKAASDWIQPVHLRGPDVLPSGTGRPFAQRTYKVLLSRFGSPDIAQEAMSSVLLQVARKKVHVKNGASVHEAESYFLTIALNAARDIARARGRRREAPLVRERDGDESVIDVEDPNSFAELDKVLTRAQMEKLIHDLRDVHPRAPDWLRARLDGDSGQEIAADWGTTPSWVSKWQRLYLPRVKQLVEERLRTAATEEGTLAREAWWAGWSSTA